MSAAAKFIEEPSRTVDDALKAFCWLHRETVVRIDGTNVVTLRQVSGDRVALICGGGSGHEPAHVDFVRQQWLTAAVCGDVFASPPTSAVTAAIDYVDKEQRRRATAAPPGILVLVKNYTGDVLNFGFAVREASSRGIDVQMLVIGDDVAFGIDHSGRRGIAGTVLLYQLLGAAAWEGASLSRLMTIGDWCAKSLRSFGVSLSSCTLPGSPKNVEVANGHMELGLGIHGERGASVAPCAPVSIIVSSVLDNLFPPSNHKPSKDPTVIALLLNNLGATTDLEMYSTMRFTLDALAARGISVSRAAVTRSMTALDMHGISWTVLLASSEGSESQEDEEAMTCEVLRLLASSTNKITFLSVDDVLLGCQPNVVPGPPSASQLAAALCSQHKSTASDGNVSHLIKDVFEGLDAQHERFNRLDAEVGDGDTGFGVSRASRAILSVKEDLPWTVDPRGSLRFLAKTIADAFAGSSGPLYGAFLVAASDALPSSLLDVVDEAKWVDTLRSALARGTQSIAELGGAKPGERTMVDVLHAVVHDPAFQHATTVRELLCVGVHAAETAALNVRSMRATKGRSRYLGGKEIGKEDPGSELVVEWLRLACVSYETRSPVVKK